MKYVYDSYLNGVWGNKLLIQKHKKKVILFCIFTVGQRTKEEARLIRTFIYNYFTIIVCFVNFWYTPWIVIYILQISIFHSFSQYNLGSALLTACSTRFLAFMQHVSWIFFAFSTGSPSFAVFILIFAGSVSYTHLTLPTILLV